MHQLLPSDLTWDIKCSKKPWLLKICLVWFQKQMNPRILETLIWFSYRLQITGFYCTTQLNQKVGSLNLLYELGQVNQFCLSVKFKHLILMNSILICFLGFLSKPGIRENGLMTSFLDTWKAQASPSAGSFFHQTNHSQGSRMQLLRQGSGVWTLVPFSKRSEKIWGWTDQEGLTCREAGHLQIFTSREFWARWQMGQ